MHSSDFQKWGVLYHAQKKQTKKKLKTNKMRNAQEE